MFSALVGGVVVSGLQGGAELDAGLEEAFGQPQRIDLDDAIVAFGFDRTELEAELEAGLDADLAAGRE